MMIWRKFRDCNTLSLPCFLTHYTHIYTQYTVVLIFHNLIYYCTYISRRVYVAESKLRSLS